MQIQRDEDGTPFVDWGCGRAEYMNGGYWAVTLGDDDVTHVWLTADEVRELARHDRWAKRQRAAEAKAREAYGDELVVFGELQADAAAVIAYEGADK